MPALPVEIEPRHLHLSLSFAPAEGRTYKARGNDGSSSQGWRELVVPLREDDLSEVCDGLREALENVRRYLSNKVQLSEEEAVESEYLKLVDQLARRGNDAFNRLFPNEGDREYISRSLTRAVHPNFEISSDSFFLPWELLYEPYDPSGVSLQNFWGFRYNISRVLTDVRQKQSPQLTISGPPRVALFANPDLPNVLEQELPYFRELNRGGDILLRDWLSDLRPETDTRESRAQRSSFFEYCRNQESDVAHFACHAVVEKYSRDSHITLSSHLRVHLEDMTVEKFILAGSPFVVLTRLSQLAG